MLAIEAFPRGLGAFGEGLWKPLYGAGTSRGGHRIGPGLFADFRAISEGDFFATDVNFCVKRPPYLRSTRRASPAYVPTPTTCSPNLYVLHVEQLRLRAPDLFAIEDHLGFSAIQSPNAFQAPVFGSL
jgi:hypothetical protein